MPHLGFPQKIFAVLDVWDHHVVLTLSFKLVSFFTFIQLIIQAYWTPKPPKIRHTELSTAFELEVSKRFAVLEVTTDVEEAWNNFRDTAFLFIFIFIFALLVCSAH